MGPPQVAKTGCGKAVPSDACVCRFVQGWLHTQLFRRSPLHCEPRTSEGISSDCLLAERSACPEGERVKESDDCEKSKPGESKLDWPLG